MVTKQRECVLLELRKKIQCVSNFATVPNTTFIGCLQMSGYLNLGIY